MSAPDEHALNRGGEEGEMAEMEEEEEDEGVEMEDEEADGDGGKKVYVPGIEPLQPGEELEMDRSAYRVYHECQTGEFRPGLLNVLLKPRLQELKPGSKGFLF